jgi:hypothetical protein
MPHALTPPEFRADLLSPVAFHRVKALHALELQAQGLSDARLAAQIAAFTARGVPYYALDDQHYTAWVQQAVSLWTQVSTLEAHA